MVPLSEPKEVTFLGGNLHLQKLPFAGFGYAATVQSGADIYRPRWYFFRRFPEASVERRFYYVHRRLRRTEVHQMAVNLIERE